MPIAANFLSSLEKERRHLHSMRGHNTEDHYLGRIFDVVNSLSLFLCFY
uniref:Uncharacterized protein n=1 Tax=Lepeophtheirus salmonis TaxID=72036 RepID=A0A0K2U8N8_LEPSM